MDDTQISNVEYNRQLNLKPLSDEEALKQYQEGLGESLEGAEPLSGAENSEEGGNG